MFIERDQRSQFLDLEQFAFNHLLGQFDECIEDAEVPFLHRDFKGLHVKPIASQDALEFPHCVFAAGRPRRVCASSMMSSWTRVAVWMISITAPILIAPRPV